MVQTVVDLGGYPVVLSDTAGLRTTIDPVESEGVCRALVRASKADLAIVVLEASHVLSAMENETFEWNEYLRNHLISLGIINKETNEQSPEWIENQCFITVINKMDLIEEENKPLIQNVLENSCSLVSLQTQEGFEIFLEKLTVLCGSLCDVGTVENPTLTAARHRTQISSCLETLKLVLQPNYKENFTGGSRNASSPMECVVSEVQEGHNLLQSEDTLVLAAYLLHRAANSLGHVTGHITSEDVLDHIFSAFCIGK